MIITETYTDIRLVGVPPLSMGRFGGDEDNWEWPRHTADFSMYRIYANAENHPANFDQKNQPYKPKKYFTLSTGGLKEGDFAMVCGFPGRTMEYVPSFAVELIQNVSDPARVCIREKRLKIWRDRMNSDESIRMKYISKYATLENPCKKWRGEMTGLRRNKVIQEKSFYEGKFNDWVGKDGSRRNEYSGVLHEMELFYSQLRPLSRLNEYYNECFLGSEIISFINNNIRPLETLAAADSIPEDSLRSAATKLLKGVPGFFKNYDAKTDEMILAAMLKLFHDSTASQFIPTAFAYITSKYRDNYDRYAHDVFYKSIFTDQGRLISFLQTFSHRSLKRLRKDPAFMLFASFSNMMNNQSKEDLTRYNNRISSLQTRYMKAQMEMNKQDEMYPDANLTLRFAYGQVAGYRPADAVQYACSTSVSGILEKYDPGNPDFNVPEKLVALIASKDFGPYSENGDIPCAFITNCHTTSGNSGSPVINAQGELIGTNFDRVWEGTDSDLKFQPATCRNIAIDIRYTLFVIDKFAGAQSILAELHITK